MTETLTVIRTFDAPLTLVWGAVTKPEHFAIWFGTADVAVPLDELDWNPAVGAAWNATMHLPDGNLIHWAGEFQEIDAPDRIVFTMTDAPDEYDGLPVTISLRQVAGGTELTYHQHTPGFDDERVEATRHGVDAFFDTMARDVLGL